MSKKLSYVTLVAFMLLYGFSNVFAFTSGSTGSLGAFNPTTNTEVELPADGILNYTTVNIPAGVTVTFKKNAANTPVYVLATGDVIIAGTISVNGTNGSSIYPGKGGNSGFEGGLGGTPIDGSNPALPGGKGLGPGGGNPGPVPNNAAYLTGAGGGGGGFGSNGSAGTGQHSTFAPPGTGGGSYSNMRILPLIGGSGGGGGAGSSHPSFKNSGGGGGGGGGAVLIASSGTITVTGTITANGGNGAGCSGTGYSGGGGGGSGGAIKIMAQTIAGNGTISATGGTGGSTSCTNLGGAGGSGRIRFEANLVTRTTATTPMNTYSYPGTVFVSSIPTLRITAVGGVNVPANPTGIYGSTDITLPSTTTNPVTVNISATNIPVGTSVTVSSVPEYGASTSGTGTLSGTSSSSTASVSITLSTTYQCILMAQATFTVQTAMYWDDEKIEKVRVASTMGGESSTVYITEKGREIPAAELMARLTLE